MKNAFLIFLIYLGVGVQSSSGQEKRYTDISYLKISDSALIDGINKVVNQEVNNPDDSLFKKGFGYIRVSVIQYPKNDTVIVYYIAPELSAITKKSIEQVYPDYYSFVNGRLVLITMRALDVFASREFSEKSKKNIRELVDKCLEKTQKVTFYDENNKKAFTDKHFRTDYLLFGSGKELYIFKNKPAVLKRPAYY
ncbi:MAG: hypothetical protein V4560_03720 [Bacteroidota bacterium]